MTFSIVARSADGSEWGVAVASKFLAVGSVVPAAVAGLGAIATQAMCNVSYKGLALAHLDEGATAQVALDRLVEEDAHRAHRQVGIVDLEGQAATFTGEACSDFAGGLTGEGVAIQGNILTGPDVLDDMLRAWNTSSPELPLVQRLMSALTAGDAAGGDKRGRQSAAIFVVREEGGYGGLDDVAVDLRVDDHATPLNELERLLRLHSLHLSVPTEDDKVWLDATLRDEVEAKLAALGYPDLMAWAGTENYEMRVDPAEAWIDATVLEILRQENS